MAGISEKELEQKRQKNQKLRRQIAEAETKAAQRTLEISNEVEGARLDAETARLEAQLAAAREAAKVSTAREGAASTFEAVDEQRQAAEQAASNVGSATAESDK